MPSGQLQMHRATHPIRIAAPGNGWGGTTAMGCEVDAWCRHTNRWQRTPPWPILAVWFCPEYRQFSIVMQNLREVAFGSTPWFHASGFGGPRFVWPDGSVMYLASYDRSWKHLQGIEIDLVCFDEQPPAQLWREMMQRRRAKRKTKYICKATQTEGWSWIAEEIYGDWLKFHQDRGLDEERAMTAQLHPRYWLWPRGGIHDNPAASEDDCVWYETQPWPSAKERKVRLFGGFENWLNDPVFDVEGMERMEKRALELDDKIGRGRDGSFNIRRSDTTADLSSKPLLELRPDQLRDQYFEFMEVREQFGRISLYEIPQAGHVYAVGGDTAYGIDGRDFDALVVLDKDTTPVRQIAEVHGHWGERFDRVVYATCMFFSEAFLLIESQTLGLAILQRLYREYIYRWLYYNRNEAHSDRPFTDNLGYHTGSSDLAMRNFREAVVHDKVTIRSPTLRDQMNKVKWHNPTEETKRERGPDEKLKMKLMGGGSPDLVRAAAGAWHALQEVHKFPPPPSRYAPDTYGALFGHDEAFGEKQQPVSFAGRRGRV